MNYELFEVDKDDVRRVEATDHDAEGDCYGAIFYGSGAEQRAEEYAEWMETRVEEPVPV